MSGRPICVAIWPHMDAGTARITVPVGAGQTMAEALPANGIRVPTACTTGVCGTCLTRVVAGIPEHRDVFRSPDSHQQPHG